MVNAIHFQRIPDKGKAAKELFNSGKMFIASIVPNLLDRTMKTPSGKLIHNYIHMEENYYPEEFIKILQDNAENPNVFWAQEGYRHCCERCFEKYEKKGWPDPFHEHVCLTGHAQSLEEQRYVIKEGRKLIEKKKQELIPHYIVPQIIYTTKIH